MNGQHFCTKFILITDHNFGPPSNLQANRVTSRSFRVTWSEPSVRYDTTVHIDNYQIRVFDYQENRTISGHTYTGQYYHEEGSLHPNYDYQIKVSATVAGIHGPVASHSVQTSEDSKSTIYLLSESITCLLYKFTFIALCT